MVIDLRLHERLLGGFSASVFAVGDKVYKVFFSLEDPLRHTREGHKQIFESQCAAFELASQDSALKKHIPTFYGPCPIEDLLDEAGNTTSERYMLDCCYVLERLSGEELKLREAKDKYPHIDQITILFDNCGIRTRDASVFSAEDANAFKLIDIEMND